MDHSFFLRIGSLSALILGIALGAVEKTLAMEGGHLVVAAFIVSGALLMLLAMASDYFSLNKFFER